jgi:hypothetical protein
MAAGIPAVAACGIPHPYRRHAGHQGQQQQQGVPRRGCAVHALWAVDLCVLCNECFSDVGAYPPPLISRPVRTFLRRQPGVWSAADQAAAGLGCQGS